MIELVRTRIASAGCWGSELLFSPPPTAQTRLIPMLLPWLSFEKANWEKISWENSLLWAFFLHLRFLFLNYRNNWTSDFYHVESKLDLLLCRRENAYISVKNASFVLRFSKVSLCAMETFLFKVVCGFSVALCNSRLRSYEFLSFR